MFPRLLRGFAAIYLVVLAIVFLWSAIWTTYSATTFWEGLGTVGWWLSPFNIGSFLVNVACLAPGLGAWWLSDRIERNAGRGTEATKKAPKGKRPDVSGVDARSELDRADETVQAYSAVLQNGSKASLHPLSALPASADEVKHALLAVARHWRDLGKLLPEAREHFQMTYGLLATFVPDEIAKQPTKVDLVTRAAAGTRDDLQRALNTDTALADEAFRRSNSEMARLLEEFETQLPPLQPDRLTNG